MPRPKGSRNKNNLPKKPEVVGQVIPVDKNLKSLNHEELKVINQDIVESSKYDILWIPLGAFNRKEPGKLFVDLGWEKKFNSLIDKGYYPKPIGMRNDLVVIWFEK